MIRVLTFKRLPGNTGENRIFRVALIWSPNVPRTPHGNTVIITRSSFRTHNVIIFSPSGQMGCLNTAPIRSSSPHPLRIADNSLLFGFILYHTDSTRLFIAFPRFPFQRYNVFLSIVIMKNRCIKTGRMKIDRLTPRPADIPGCNQVIIHIKIPRIHGIHHPVNHIK